MTAPTTARKLLGLRNAMFLFAGLTYLWFATGNQAFFNDANYANLRADLDKTLSYADDTPEQTVTYMTLGKHLDKPVYGTVTGIDFCKWIRDPNNPVRPLFALHPQLKNDWATKGEDGLSNSDHYNGFLAGPVSSARTLFQESAPEHLARLNVLLTETAGTNPETLDRTAQEALIWKVLVEGAEGRAMLSDLHSRRMIGEQTRGYVKMAKIAGSIGTTVRWVQHNFLVILVGLFLVRTTVVALRRQAQNRRETRAALIPVTVTV